MNFLKISLILLIFSQNISSQTIEKLEFDKNYFLFGSLSEDSGKLRTDKSFEPVDHYFSNEERIFNKLYCLFKSEYPSLELKKINGYNFIMVSKELNYKVASWYKWTVDENVTNENDDVFYSGILDTTLIKTKSQKASFLIGVIDRSGKFQNNNIELNILCSDEKYNMIINLLNEFNCKIISDIYYKDNIPNPHVITFIPSDIIVGFLKTSNCQ